MSTLDRALKTVRHNIYKYGKDWRTLIVTKRHDLVKDVFNEVISLMNASSLLVTDVNYARRRILTDRGGIIDVRALGDMLDAYTLAGSTYTNVIWTYEPAQDVESYVRAFMRSPVVDFQALVEERVQP